MQYIHAPLQEEQQLIHNYKIAKRAFHIPS